MTNPLIDRNGVADGELKDPPAPPVAAYSRFLKLSPIVMEALKNYITQQIEMHRAERTAFDDEMIKYQKDYWAKASEAPKTFPFVNAAKLIIPLTAISVEAVHARTMTTLFGLKQLVSAKAKSEAWADAQGPYERHIGQELKAAKFRENIESSILEIEKLGTGLGRAEWEQQIKYGIRSVGGREVEFPVYTKRGAFIYSVPLSRFVMPFACMDVQSAPWCGELHITTQHDLYLGEQSGLYEQGTYAKLYNWVQTNSVSDKSQTEQELLDLRQPVWPARLEFYKLFLSYDVDNSGVMKEICVLWHHDSRSFMGIRYNDYHDLRRPYRKGVYFPVEYRWTGIGIGKQNEAFQEEVTTQHRQRIDNATIANMRMFKVSRLSGYSPKEPIGPGKMWFLDDMSHVESLQMGEVYNSAYNNENQTLLYSQQRTGVNDVTLGMPQVGTPGTATGDLARVAEGRKKYDYVYNNIKSYVNELVADFASLQHKYGPRRVEYLDDTPGNQLVKRFLELPEEAVADGMIIEVGMAGEQDNRLIDRSNWTQIAGTLQQYYTALLDIARNMKDMELYARISMKAMQASSEAMRQLLESFDVRNIDRIVMMEFINNPTGTPNGNTGLINAGNASGGSPTVIGASTQPPISNAAQILTSGGGGGASQLSRILQSLGGV